MTFKEKLKHSWWHWYDDAWRKLKEGKLPNNLYGESCACCEYIEDPNDWPCKVKTSNCPISEMSGRKQCRKTPYQNEEECTLKDAEMELMYLQLCYYWHGFRGEIWE